MRREAYARALERSGWPAETLSVQRIGPWQLERVLLGYTFNALVTHQASFSPDGELLARSTGGGLELWDRDQRQVALPSYVPVEGGPLDLGLRGETLLEIPDLPDSSSWTGDDPARLWRLTTGELIAELGAGTSCLAGTHLSEGRGLVTAHGDETLRWWGLDGALSREFRFPLATDARVLVPLPAGGFLSGGPRSSSVFVWSAEGEVERQLPAPESSSVGITGVTTIAVDVKRGRVVIVYGDGLCSLRSWPEGDERGARVLGSRPREVALLQDCLVVASWGDPNAADHSAVLNLETSDLADLVQVHPNAPLALHEAASWGVVGHAMSTQSWKVTNPEEVSVEDCESIRFNADGERALVIAFGCLSLWRLESGECQASLPTMHSFLAPRVSPGFSRVLIPWYRGLGGRESLVLNLELGETHTWNKELHNPALSRDFVVDVSDKGLEIRRLASGEALWTASVEDRPEVMAFVDESLFVAKFQGSLGLWSSEAPSPIAHVALPLRVRTGPARHGGRPRSLLVAGLARSGLWCLAVSGGEAVGVFKLPELELMRVLDLELPADQSEELEGLEWIDGFLCIHHNPSRGWEVWDAERGAVAKDPPLHLAARHEFAFPEGEQTIAALGFSADGSRALVATDQGSLLSYRREVPNERA